MNPLILLLPFSGFVIDMLTLIIHGILSLFKKPYYYIARNKSQHRKPKSKRGKNNRITVIIPAHNEEKSIAESIESALKQTLKPEWVIVVDDKSTDKTGKICKTMKKKYPKLRYIRKNIKQGKGKNISETIMKERISPLFVVLDGDSMIERDYLEKVTKEFEDENTVIVTGVAYSLEPFFFEGRFSTSGKMFLWKLFSFRKKAQNIRNAISVICGDSAAFRTEYLRGIGGFPEGTLTEDVDVTWKALEDGHRVKSSSEARASCYDMYDIGSHWRQVYRWFRGNVQCLFKHGRDIFKSKKLAFTTIVPTYLDTLLYTPLYLLTPILFFFLPELAISFLLLDFFLLSIMLLLVERKGFLQLIEIYFARFLWSTAWISALVVTTCQLLKREGHKWSGSWSREADGNTTGSIALILLSGFYAWFATNCYFFVSYAIRGEFFPWIIIPILIFIPSIIYLIYQLIKYGFLMRRWVKNGVHPWTPDIINPLRFGYFYME